MSAHIWTRQDLISMRINLTRSDRNVPKGKEPRLMVRPFRLAGGNDQQRSISVDLKLARRFWLKVQIGSPGQCWNWLAGVNEHGYGLFTVAGKTRKAHRVAYELLHGPILRGEGAHGNCVLHRCDNRRCCNPNHHRIGPHLLNMADLAEKGSKKGIPRPPRVFLNSRQISVIRRCGMFGLNRALLSRIFGVAKSTITNLIACRRRAELELMAA